MGRMFRIITEGNLDQPVMAAGGEPFAAGDAPYIEVGGANGPVFHNPHPPAPAPTQPAAVGPRRAAGGDGAYLSVALHDLRPRGVEPLAHAVHPDVVAYHHPGHTVAAEYRRLAADVRRQVGDDGPKAVLFTAAAADAGTTTVALNLAVTLAAEPSVRVLVIDADIDRPGAATKMGLADFPGLAEVLAGQTPVAWALQPTPVPRLQVLAAGKPGNDTVAALTTDLPRLVAHLRQWFDYLLVDGGVWGERPNRDATAPAFDGVYLVTRQVETDGPAFAALRTQVARHGGLLRGYITTKA